MINFLMLMLMLMLMRGRNNMKGHPEVIASLNERLEEYHASLLQNISHSALCKKLGFGKLKEYFDHLVKEDRVVLFKLIERILFLDGSPDIIGVAGIAISPTSHETLLFTSNAKIGIIAGLGSSLDIANKFKDHGTRRLLEDLLVEEEKHLASVEAKMNKFTEKGEL